jgi:hypothetical protein
LVQGQSQDSRCVVASLRETDLDVYWIQRKIVELKIEIFASRDAATTQRFWFRVKIKILVASLRETDLDLYWIQRNTVELKIEIFASRDAATTQRFWFRVKVKIFVASSRRCVKRTLMFKESYWL